MEALAKLVGFPSDQLRYVVCLFAAIAVAPLFRRVPSPVLKHVFSIVFSISCCLFCLGPLSWVHSFASSLVAYGIMKFAPRNVSHLVVFVWAFLYMSASHLYRMYDDYMGWTLDFTGPQMVLTLKLVSIAFCYADGIKTTATEDQKKRAVKTLPNLLEFFGYVYFYPSFLAGPSCEFSDYQRFVSGVINDDVVKGKQPPVLFPTLEALGLGVLNMVILVLLGAKFSLKELLRSYTEGKESISFRILRLYVSPFLLRTRYYFGWKVAEAAFIACGFGYNGKGAEPDPSQLQKIQWYFFGIPPPAIKFDRANNVRIASVEMGTNMREVSIYWNKKTGEWLRDYIYNRVPKAIDPTFATFIVSAFWHGFYPGYYLFFVFLAVGTTTTRHCRRAFRPLFQGSAFTRTLYDVLTTLATVTVNNYAGIGFALLGWEANMKFYGSCLWIGHIIFVLGFVAMPTLASVLAPKQAIREGRPAPVKKTE